MKIRALLLLTFAFALASARARADVGDGGIVDAGAAAVNGCVESIPSGMTRPTLFDVFPTRGLSGYSATLQVTIEHGKGESVLPRGLDLQSASDAAKELKTAGFAIPDQDGGAGARLSPNPNAKPTGDRASTILELPLVALPPEPGRHLLVLPPVPIAVARANGEIATVCTRPHSIVVEDPTASTPEAKPHPNPPPLKQREEWTTLKHAVEWGALGLVLGAIAFYFARKWMMRPKPVPPPPPPRPPWEVALEKLDEVRHAGLLDVGRHAEYFDRVNDAVRSYLGARYGFDGLESTTDEIVRSLKGAQIYGVALPEVVLFLQECDLVKFANLTPTPDDCARALAAGEMIVRTTMPRDRAFGSQQPPPPPPPSDVPREPPSEVRA